MGDKWKKTLILTNFAIYLSQQALWAVRLISLAKAIKQLQAYDYEATHSGAEPKNKIETGDWIGRAVLCNELIAKSL